MKPSTFTQDEPREFAAMTGSQTTELMKTKIGTSGEHPNPKPKRGWSRWIENGVWFTAPKVSAAKFGGHDYAGGGYSRGIRDCKCGCYMLSSSSGGDCDPFGPCPENPKAKSGNPQSSARRAASDAPTRR